MINTYVKKALEVFILVFYVIDNYLEFFKNKKVFTCLIYQFNTKQKV